MMLVGKSITPDEPVYLDVPQRYDITELLADDVMAGGACWVEVWGTGVGLAFDIAVDGGGEPAVEREILRLPQEAVPTHTVAMAATDLRDELIGHVTVHPGGSVTTSLRGRFRVGYRRGANIGSSYTRRSS